MFRRRRADPGNAPAEAVAPAGSGHDGPEGDPALSGTLGQTSSSAGGPSAVGGAESVGDRMSGRPARIDGPFDASEVDLDHLRATPGNVDLGGVVLRPGDEGVQIQVQLDRDSGQVTGVLLVHEDAAVQIVAVAAPRSRPLWPEVYPAMAADAKQRGGQSAEVTGAFGAELHVRLPVTLPDGKPGIQPSRFVGIDGPRWLLRAQFLGRAALEAEAFALLDRAMRATVVVRGSEPRPPGDPLPLHLPPTTGPVAGLDEEPPGDLAAPPTPDPGPGQPAEHAIEDRTDQPE